MRAQGPRPEGIKSSAPQDGWWICERYCVPSRGSGSSAGCSQEALLARCQACRWRAAARLRAHPRTTGESRTCRSRPVAAGSLRGAAAPREVVISAAVRRPSAGVSLMKRWDQSAVGSLTPRTDESMRTTLHILRSTAEVHSAVSMALACMSSLRTALLSFAHTEVV